MNDLMNLLGDIDKKSQPVLISDGFEDFSSRAKTDFIPERLPLEITLRGYQVAAVETILKFRRGILGFSPGMGKTPTAITAIANLGGKTVIVIPPSLIHDPWKKEFIKLFPDITFQVVGSRTPYKINDDVEVVIIGDSVVGYWADALIKWNPNNLIVDEAQRHKNRNAKRAQGVSDIADHIRSNDGVIILMTGTLATNDAEEVWMPAQIAGIATTITGSSSYNKWCNRWCFMDDMMVEKNIKGKDGKKKEKKSIWIRVPSGCKDPVGLHEALRSTAYIRIEREDVLDMPDKLFVQHSMMADDAVMKEYKAILNDFEQWVYDNGGSDAVDRISGSEKLVQLGKLVERAGLAKVKSSAEYVAAMVEQDEQVVVMAHHKSVVAAFAAELGNLNVSYATFTGSDSPAKKANNIDAFKSGKVHVLIGNIQSAGTGLNLENSANLVFIQLPWSPTEFEQASDRIYRVTQTRQCTIHTLYTANTVEEHVMDVLNKKALITDGINAGIDHGETYHRDRTVDDSDSFVDDVFGLMLMI